MKKGVVLGLVGITLAAITGFYFYKKEQKKKTKSETKPKKDNLNSEDVTFI